MVDVVYEMPEEAEKLVHVLEAVPSGWSWVDGYLLAPQSLYDSHQIAEETRLVVSRHYETEPTLIWANDLPFEDEDIYTRERNSGGRPANLIEVVGERKQVSSVAFREAGYDSKVLTFDFAKGILQEFVRRGYKGWATIFSRDVDNRKYNNPEKVHIGHTNPGNITLSWNEEYSGKLENLRTIIDACETVGLRELEPAEES